MVNMVQPQYFSRGMKCKSWF